MILRYYPRSAIGLCLCYLVLCWNVLKQRDDTISLSITPIFPTTGASQDCVYTPTDLGVYLSYTGHVTSSFTTKDPGRRSSAARTHVSRDQVGVRKLGRSEWSSEVTEEEGEGCSQKQDVSLHSAQIAKNICKSITGRLSLVRIHDPDPWRTSFSLRGTAGDDHEDVYTTTQV